MKGDFLGLRHPFFIPVWRRIATVGVCFGWMVVEFWIGSPGWAVLFGATGVVAAYGLFVGFDPDEIRAKSEKDNKNG